MSEAWAGICVLGFWGWVLATVGFILQGFPSAGKCSVRSLSMWGSLVLGFYVLWIVGMLNA